MPIPAPVRHSHWIFLKNPPKPLAEIQKSCFLEDYDMTKSCWVIPFEYHKANSGFLPRGFFDFLPNLGQGLKTRRKGEREPLSKSAVLALFLWCLWCVHAGGKALGHRITSVSSSLGD